MLFLNQLINNLISKIEFLLNKMPPERFVGQIRKKLRKNHFFMSLKDYD
jgi:hypothetical protein